MIVSKWHQLLLLHPGVREQDNGHHYQPFRHRVAEYPHLFHVWDMLDSHAIYFGTRAFAMAFMLAVHEAAVLAVPYDIISARIYMR